MKYNSSRAKILLFLAASIAFVVVGWLFRQKIPMYFGYVAMAFGTAGFIVFTTQLLPGASVLKLNDESFTYTVLFKKSEVPWKSVECFYEVTLQDGKTKKVGWLYSPEVMADIEAKQGAPLDASIPHGILPDNYGKKANELVSILNQFMASRV